MLTLQTILRRNPPSKTLATSRGFAACTDIIRSAFLNEARHLRDLNDQLVVGVDIQRGQAISIGCETLRGRAPYKPQQDISSELFRCMTDALTAHFSPEEMVNQIVFVFGENEEILASVNFDLVTVESDIFDQVVTKFTISRHMWMRYLFGCDTVVGDTFVYSSMPIAFGPIWPSYRFGYFAGAKDDRIWFMSNGLSNPDHPSKNSNWRNNIGLGVELITSCGLDDILFDPEGMPIEYFLDSPHFVLFDAICGTLVNFKSAMNTRFSPTAETSFRIPLTYSDMSDNRLRPIPAGTEIIYTAGTEFGYDGSISLPNGEQAIPYFVSVADVSRPSGGMSLPAQFDLANLEHRPITDVVDDFIKPSASGSHLDAKASERLQAYCGLEIVAGRRVPTEFIHFVEELDLSDYGALRRYTIAGENFDLKDDHSSKSSTFSDLSLIASLVNLKVLDLRATDVDDLAQLKVLKSLQELRLCQNRVSKLDSLRFLTSLRKLHLTGTAVKDLSPISKLPKLEQLFLTGTPVIDLGPLIEISTLRDLSLWGFRWDDFSQLGKFIQLTHLNIAQTSLTDLSVLASLTNLEELQIWGTEITDLSPLRSLRNLKFVNARELDVVDWSPVAHVENVLGRP